MEENQFLEIQGLNDDEFNSIINNTQDLSIFITTSNMELLTQEQLDVINNI
jgi:hypothetical protein